MKRLGRGSKEVCGRHIDLSLTLPTCGSLTICRLVRGHGEGSSRKGESGLDSVSVGHTHKGLCCVQSPIPQERKKKEKGDKLGLVAHVALLLISALRRAKQVGLGRER